MCLLGIVSARNSGSVLTAVRCPGIWDGTRTDTPMTVCSRRRRALNPLVCTYCLSKGVEQSVNSFTVDEYPNASIDQCKSTCNALCSPVDPL